MDRPGVHLLRTRDRIAEVDALVARADGRVGLPGVLDDLNRRAHVVAVPAPAAAWGFRWDREDTWSGRWWPQGITGGADAHDDGLVDGRSVLVTSAYAKDVDRFSLGSRLTFVDLTDPAGIRYRHVLLVEPLLRDDGAVDVRPVHLHAGGIVWHGDYVHVAGTELGFTSFRLDDIVRVDPKASLDTFGYRYVLPVRFTYEARAGYGAEQMRYSFAALDRTGTPYEIVAGEYGRGGQTTRLARYPIDPATSLPRTGDGACHPSLLCDGGVPRMQGATVVAGIWFVTSSNGRFGLGSMWVGRPGSLVERRRRLPVGPEDLAYWPGRDELWSLSEYPGARYVFAMSRAHLGRR